MSDDATPRLSLPYLAAAQAQKHVTVNQGLSLLDGLVQTAVQSRTTSAQPPTPSDGALYILPEASTGADWAPAASGALMRFEAGAWSPLPAGVGCVAFVKDEARLVVLTTAGWVDAATAIGLLQNIARLGVDATADAANPLAVSGPGALFTHAGAGMQLKLNKATAGDTASLLCQTGFSGRAEIGLCGDDRLHVKVSPDGATWTEALVIDGQGRTGLGVTPTARLQVDGALRLKAYARAALPFAAGEGAGAVIYVPDDAAGATLAFSDGTVWRRTHDLAVMS